MDRHFGGKKAKDFVWVSLLVLFSFALRFTAWNFDRTITRDAAYYIQMGECWRESRSFDAIIAQIIVDTPMLNNNYSVIPRKDKSLLNKH